MVESDNLIFYQDNTDNMSYSEKLNNFDVIENNPNNLAKSSNYRIFLPILKNPVHYAQSINLPGFSLTTYEVDSRFGGAMLLGGTTIAYDAVTISLIMDEKFDIYKELMRFLSHNVKSNNGCYGNVSFSIGIDITDSLGKSVFGIVMTGARLESVGGLDLNSNSEDSNLNLSLTFKFDDYYIPDFEKEDFFKKMQLQTTEIDNKNEK